MNSILAALKYPRLFWVFKYAACLLPLATCEPRFQCMPAPEGDSCLVEKLSWFQGKFYSNCDGRPLLCSKPQRDPYVCPPPPMLPPAQLPGSMPTVIHKGTYFFVQRLVPFNRLHTALGDILGMRNVLRDFGQPQLDGIILFDNPGFESQARSEASLNCAKMFVDFFKCNVTYAADLDTRVVHQFERGFMGIGGHDFMYVDDQCVSRGDFVTYRAEWYRAVGLEGADRGSSSGLLPRSFGKKYRDLEAERLSAVRSRAHSMRQGCRSAFIANKRKFANQDDIITSLKSTLTKLNCPLVMVDWKDYPNMSEELGMMRDINVYITTIGSGAMNAVFLPRGSVVVNLGWLDDDPSTGSSDFKASLGGFQDAFIFPAMQDVRTLYYTLPIRRIVNTTVLAHLVTKAVNHFRNGYAIPVLRVDNQDLWGQACAAIFKANKHTHREMLTDHTTHYCQQYLKKYHDVTTFEQLGTIVGDNANRHTS